MHPGKESKTVTQFANKEARGRMVRNTRRLVHKVAYSKWEIEHGLCACTER